MTSKMATLVLGPGLRHRGVGYAERNVNFILHFWLVAAAKRASKARTTRMKYITHETPIIG